MTDEREDPPSRRTPVSGPPAGGRRTSPPVTSRLAEALERTTGLSQDQVRPALDAWQRLGLLSSLSDLTARNPGELSAALVRAARRGIIPAVEAEKAAALAADLQAAAVKQTLAQPLRDGGTSIAELLTLASVSETRSAQIVQRLVTFDGAPEIFWDMLSRDTELAEPAARLRLNLELGALTDFHAPVLEALLALKRRGDFASARDLSASEASPPASWRTSLGRFLLPPWRNAFHARPIRTFFG